MSWHLGGPDGNERASGFSTVLVLSIEVVLRNTVAAKGLVSKVPRLQTSLMD